MNDANPASLTVLLVENNLGDCRLAEIALREGSRDAAIDCRVEAADSLAAALRTIEDAKETLDAILLDLGLPDALGLEGLRTLRSAAPHAAIIVLTGLCDLKIATGALKNGASDYLEKAEILPGTLLRAIRYAIERKKSEAELVRLAR